MASGFLRPQKRKAPQDNSAVVAPPSKRQHVEPKRVLNALDLGTYRAQGDDGLAAIVNHSCFELNPLTIELVLKRNAEGEESLKISGYHRTFAYTAVLEKRVDHVSKWLKQGQVGDKIPRSHIESVTNEIGALNIGHFRHGPKKPGEVVVYGKLVPWIALGIEAHSVKALHRQDDGMIEFYASTTGLHVHEPICLRDNIEEGLYDEYEANKGGLTPDEAKYLAQKEAFHQRIAREAAEQAADKSLTPANAIALQQIADLDLCEPTAHLAFTRIDKETIKAEITGYPRKTPYSATVQQRVDILLAKAGLRGYGAIPKKCVDAKQLPVWIKPFNALSTSTSPCSVEVYGKELKPLLRAVDFEFVSNSLQLEIKKSISPDDGLVTLSIANLVPKPQFWRLVWTSVLDMYKDTKCRLTKDEKVLWQEKMKADQAEDISEAELIRALEAEMQKTEEASN